MSDREPMTTEGFRQLNEELKRIRSEERPKIIRAIEVALDHGDLSENAEYDAAKESQQQLDQRTKQIEDRLARAQIINPRDVKGDKVVFGATVELTDLDKDRRVVYQVVGRDEADLSNGKLSVAAPLARAMIGKHAGDFFSFNSPAGQREYVVEEIRFE